MPKKRRLLTFRLRTLLIGTALAGSTLGLWVNPALRQHRAVIFYEQLGLRCEFEEGLLWVPAKLEERYVSFFRRLKSVVGTPVQGVVASKLFVAKIPPGFDNDTVIPEFLPNLRSVELSDMSCTNFLTSLEQLEVLRIHQPEGSLPELPRVRTLLLEPSGMLIDCELATKCPNVRMLALRGSVKNFEAVSKLKELEKLFVGSYGPRPSSIQLDPLRKLRHLQIVRLHVSDAPDLAPLLSLRMLEEVQLPHIGRDMRNSIGLDEEQMAKRQFTIRYMDFNDKAACP